MDSTTLIKRTTRFAHRAVKLACALPKSSLGRHISGQLIRCSTSVAANYRAANLAQSKASFRSKLSIVLEEIDESQFWIEFLLDEELLNPNFVMDLKKEARELRAIFYSARKSLSKRR